MKTFTPIELTAVLQLGIHSVLKLIKRGELEALDVSVCRGRPTWRITQTALERFMSRRTTQPKAEPATRRKHKQAGVIEFF